MDEGGNSKGFKLNFVTLFLFLIFLILTIGGIALVNNAKKKHEMYANEIDNKTIVNNSIQTNKKIEVISGTDFSLQFLKMENAGHNLIYSPLSIKYALNMLGDGASGNTKTQIRKVIGDEKLSAYENIDNVLSLANAIYVRDTFSSSVKKSYINDMSNKYNAEIKFDSFESANKINKWIENETFGKIKNMLSDNAVTNPNSKMILINALAIDMEWEESFDIEDTGGEKFYLENGENIDATTMKKLFEYENVSYYKDSSVTALSMNLDEYDNQQFEFIAIMPNKDLSKYIEKFEIKDLENIVSKMVPASETEDGIDVSIPKFSYEYDLELKKDLIELGITDAFDAFSADFDNMSEDEQLFVGDALHKANIEFSEDGIKAAAVTVFAMTDGMAPYYPNPIEIKINKPFIYFIRDKKTGEVWFVGSVYKPNLWEDDKENYKIDDDFVF